MVRERVGICYRVRGERGAWVIRNWSRWLGERERWGVIRCIMKERGWGRERDRYKEG